MDLDKLANHTSAKDNTQEIHNIKTCKLIKNDINTILQLKKKYSRLKYELEKIRLQDKLVSYGLIIPIFLLN